ncbi:TetR/AcrR family transcriptional regulator [Paenibacillus sp. D2_2]|uniref:TetR/AcrR family transcriptional regulator n=1 Tax=Paenibacillus sp. D2_2 TaxID=3073092 RepID=UPI0028162318|nr:TetR/AcrR family transcriptional regulator [Paenibacillus sp. D2_2]WMT41725.1 TetR/AcrR family transcriptional regulator [Paenibacillus sp. D2_2]
MVNGKKQQIIRTARKLFFEQGIVSTSMDQIAEEVPVSKMTIYKYFGSKDGLIEQVITMINEETHADFTQMMEKSNDAIEMLHHMLLYQRMSDYSAEFINDLVSVYPEYTRQMIEYNEQKNMPLFEEMVFRGQQNGHIRKDISPHLLVLYLSSMKEFMAKPGRLEPFTNMNVLADQFISLLIHGISNTPVMTEPPHE